LREKRAVAVFEPDQVQCDLAAPALGREHGDKELVQERRQVAADGRNSCRRGGQAAGRTQRIGEDLAACSPTIMQVRHGLTAVSVEKIEASATPRRLTPRTSLMYA
jgi:hypothetical protein